MQVPEGIILVDKPQGISSFDVIRRLRHKLGVKKMGHAGTLDPRASGLMIIAQGAATKTLAQFLKLPKTYEAEVVLGVATSTGDWAGKILEEREVGEIAEKKVRSVLAEMQGELQLPVPMHSAVKKDGRPLYAYARAGQIVEPPIKPMLVHEARLLGVSREGAKIILSVLFNVGSGTYIRSLAVELGRRLGVPATLRELRRTRIGDFAIDDAQPILS